MRTRATPPAWIRASLGALSGLALLAMALLVAPALTAAHPLGNFTINHYAALRVSPAAVRLDVVVDFAEIPAFQEAQALDIDDDGDISAAEAETARISRCAALIESLTLTSDEAPLPLELTAAGLSFPPGAGGLATMRLVCELEAALPNALGSAALSFVDGSYAERIGWREIVVLGDGATIAALPNQPPPTSTDVSSRLTSYPEDLLSQPLDVRSVAFTAAAGGPTLEPFIAPDASDVDSAMPGATDPPTGFEPGPGGVPGGVGAEIPDLFRAVTLTPLLAVVSILVAATLGAGHALTPGHGKTLMAAYLVGSRGTVLHAVGLGLSVTVSHTLGILVLALLVTGAEAALPADVVVRTVPLVAALGFVAIGAWMVVSEVRRRRAAKPHVHDHAAHTHEPIEHEHVHDAAHEHPHPHEHDHEPETDHGAGPEHSHGGRRHRHGPPAQGTITWRSLFALGLAGGIIPSTNALIILLGALVAGRAAFGVVLVVAFGLGMAVVLGGIGVALVLVRGRLERLPSSPRLTSAMANAPLVASVLVLGVGLWLTAQALTALPTL